ncbi:MAG: ArsA-related P-loop ATPase [Myxococcota bacterium]
MTEVHVCCGVGGTGKTTTSAAFAVAQAHAGRRVAVITIDPARRLADALGIGALDNEPRAIDLPDATGTLAALMLDRKGTWDAIVRDRASPETAERLLANPYYQAVSTRLSGSHEYMAVERLYDLVHDGDYDVVVVDTPPTQHVVDFFQAPERVRSILDRSLLAGLFDPNRFVGPATRAAFSVIERLAGQGVMRDIRTFFELFSEISQTFRERSAAVAELLRSNRTRYWLVANAEAPERNDLLGFLGELQEREMRFAGFLVNRVAAAPLGPFPTREELEKLSDAPEGWAETVPRLARLPEEAVARAQDQDARIDRLIAKSQGAPAWFLPDLPDGVRSLDGLRRLAERLPPAAPARGDRRR